MSIRNLHINSYDASEEPKECEKCKNTTFDVDVEVERAEVTIAAICTLCKKRHELTNHYYGYCD